MTSPLSATEEKQAGLCSFIPKAAGAEMQQRSSKDHTDAPGKEGGREGEEPPPSASKTAAQLLPEPWHRITNESTGGSHSYF